MPCRYLTEEWAEQALARVETDERVLEAVRGLELSLLTIILNAPEGAYGFLYVAFDASGLKEYRVGHDYHTVTRDLATPTFVVSGDYEVFARVQRGEVSQRRAVLSKQLHLTGSFLKAIRHLRALEAVTDALREIECET